MLMSGNVSLLSCPPRHMSCRPAFVPFICGGVVVLLLLLSFARPCAAVVFVDKDRPGGNGTSWAQAYKTLDAALNGTFSAQEFWIAEGTYTPAATLIVKYGHTFYGGFAGSETVRSQRNIATHPTIVDGRGVLRHVFNVVSFVPSVRFDGLTVKRGAATAASGVDASGGGIVVDKATVVIASCTFTDNNATHLGGALNLVNNPTITITGSTFKNNKSLSGAGGGAGVAMTWDKTGAQPAAIVEKSTFQGNAGGAVGGGLYSLNFPVTVRECKFVGNSSANGGAIMLDYKLAAADRIERCLFIANTATERGGAVCSYARSVEVENSVFAYNATSAIPSTGGGGGVGLHSGMQPAHYNAAYVGTFRNCTFYGNHADSAYGGGIQNIGDRPMYIYNSIFWNNSAQAYQIDFPDQPTNDIAAYTTPTNVHFTDMETLGWPTPPSRVNQTDSFAEDPLLFDPVGADNVAGTADDNLSIQDSSPCTDRADGNEAPATDIVLRSRVDNPSVPNLGTGSPNYGDIGAYEGPYSSPVVVPPPVVPDGISIPPILHLLLGRTIFAEDFEGTWPPQGWTIEDWDGSGFVWQRNDMVGSPNYCQYGSGFAAGADSDKLDSTGAGMFTLLTSPPINLFAPQAYLGYASNFQVFVSSGMIWLRISTNNGASWTTLRFQDVDDPSGGTWEVVDLTPYVGKTVLLQWVYYDENVWAWYWQIDNIVIKKEPPLPPV